MRVDLVSMLSGVLAVPLSVFASHLRSIWVPGSSTVLGWLDGLGFVKQPLPEKPSIIVIDLPSHGITSVTPNRITSIGGVPEMTDAGHFAINDENAILFLVALSVALALIAMGTAIWAECRREPTLYLSVGYICGVLAIAQVWLLASFVLGIIGVAAVLVMRHGQER
ncbi:hypothetical protein [Quatrionicoccus australiensis]|uniref:hypothetical protein n=1 Tax=Quatrionicoccus australiensis TaxID=138118 RepID=UPI001CFBC638|nr:hypothetical protein [Quatrionicoccus australiensis]MCB4358181.1 hypothetical protein [Quatrionicoccus australiensis]